MDNLWFSWIGGKLSRFCGGDVLLADEVEAPDIECEGFLRSATALAAAYICLARYAVRCA